MFVTDQDRHFYSMAVEKLTEKFEIAREFVRNNGMNSMPMEELSDLMIFEVKSWVNSREGETWLSTMGYVREGITLSGCNITINISGAICPSCSGSFRASTGMVCECCGGYICGPCTSIVDPLYNIGWCDKCLESKPLTNLLVYNE